MLGGIYAQLSIVVSLRSGCLGKQKRGGNAMLVDAEHCFDPHYSMSVGVDVESLIVCQPDNGEMALESNKPLSPIIHWVFEFASELSLITL